MQCSAKSKQTGHQCKQPAVRYKRTCRYHGGKSPKRDPQLSLLRIPYLSEFAKSTIGTEFSFAIEHSERSVLSDLYKKIETIRSEIMTCKATLNQSTSIQVAAKFFDLEKAYFEIVREFMRKYYVVERRIRSSSIDWIFSAFGSILQKSCNEPGAEYFLSKILVRMAELRKPTIANHNPLRFDVLSDEILYCQKLCEQLISKLPTIEHKISGAREILRLLEIDLEIRQTHEEILSLKYDYTIDDVYAIYNLLAEVINDSGATARVRKLLHRGLKNIGLGVFSMNGYRDTLAYATSLGVPNAA